MKALLLFLVFAGLAQAIDPVAIAATRKTLEKDKGEKVDVRGGSARLVTTSMYYEFKVKAQVPALNAATAEWALFKHGLGGRLTMTATGKKDLALRPGQIVSFDSDAVALAGAEVDGLRTKLGSVSRSKSEDLAGYSILIKAPNGKLIGSKFSSSEIAAEVKRIEELAASRLGGNAAAGQQPIRKALPGKKARPLQRK